jgi:putative acetyltransferase
LATDELRFRECGIQFADILVFMVRIRKATAADGERILDIWRGAVDATHHFLSPVDRREIEAEVVTFLPQAPLWLAVDDRDHPIGFMLLDRGHMEALFIDPSQRGLGVGRSLVQHALCIQPNLTTDVNEQNAQAVGFYEHIGFERIGRSEIDNQGRSYPLIHMRVSGVRFSQVTTKADAAGTDSRFTHF